jgi:hypothetical protein
LLESLRPTVTGAGGWYVSGKFDQYRRDQEVDGVYQAFRALGRLLLAEPDEELEGGSGNALREAWEHRPDSPPRYFLSWRRCCGSREISGTR